MFVTKTIKTILYYQKIIKIPVSHNTSTLIIPKNIDYINYEDTQILTLRRGRRASPICPNEVNPPPYCEICESYVLNKCKHPIQPYECHIFSNSV
jgi:hypothetical protein